MKIILSFFCLIFMSSCLIESDANEEILKAGEEESIGLYSFSLNGTIFHLDTNSNFISFCYSDCFDSSCCRFDSIDTAYSFIDLDTVDLNMDGFTDVIFEFYDTGYEYTAWYTYDKDRHYYSNYYFHLQNPVIVDSARLLLYTHENIGMDGDFNSQLLEFRNGDVLSYGNLTYRYDWESKVTVCKMFKSNKEVFKEINFADSISVYNDFLDRFWKENYQFFLNK